MINVPPDVAPASINSDTQLNLFNGGILSGSFNAGDLAGTSSNVEVNVFGGSVGINLRANAGSHVNISGGSVGKLFSARDESSVLVSGGTIDDDFRVNSGSFVTISGGTIGDKFRAFSGSTVTISGGSIGKDFDTSSGSSVRFLGGEFRLNGELIPGLENIGDTFAYEQTAGLSGVLSDGTPFVLSGLASDFIADDTVTLEIAALPPIGPEVIVSPSDTVPLGIRTGQTLIVTEGGAVGDNFNAGWGSKVTVNGGQIGRNFEAVGSQVTITGGLIEGYAGVFANSSVNVSGGSIAGPFDASDGSFVNISGGSLDNSFHIFSGSVANIRGGAVADGMDIWTGSVVNFSGGSIDGKTRVFTGSQMNLFGSQFLLNGVDITASLTRHVPFNITDRGVILSGVLADGSAFSFDLFDSFVNFRDYFDANASVAVILVGPGDFNGDGQVNGYDFLKWQRGESPNPLSQSDLADWEANYGMANSQLAGDFNFNGIVDGEDFLLWQRDPNVGSLADWEANYGTGATLSATSAAVPEPTSCTLTLTALCLAMSRRRAF